MQVNIPHLVGLALFALRFVDDPLDELRRQGALLVWLQNRKSHDVEGLSALGSFLQTATYRADEDVRIVPETRVIEGFQQVLVELVLVMDREGRLVEFFQLPDVFLGQVPDLYLQGFPPPGIRPGYHVLVIRGPLA